jgi:hypothetical protein
MRNKKMVLVALALILCVGIVSAAVLNYYGSITATVTIAQAVTLDNKSVTGSGVTDSMLVTDTISGSAGSTLLGGTHWLRNQANNKILVNLGTTPILPELEAYPEYRLDATVDDDALCCVLNNYIAWNDFAGLSFNYFIESGGNNWIPQCNLALRDSEGKVEYYACAGFQTAGTVNVRTSMTYNKDDFTIYNLDWSTMVNPDVNVLNPLKFKCFVMQAGDTTVDPNPVGAQQVVWISKFAFPGRAIIGIALPTLVPDGLTLQTVEFRMVYQFNIATYPAVYTIVTNVIPIGFFYP